MVYKSSGFYDAKVNSKLAKINGNGNGVVYSTDEEKDTQLIKFQRK